MVDQKENRPAAQALRGRDELPVSPLSGCLIAILIGLLGVGMVFAVGTLLTNGEIRFGGQEATATRLWLVSDDQAQGLGISRPEVVSSSASQLCVRTNTRFLLWRSDGSLSSVSYCECYRNQNGRLVFEGVCPDDL